MAATLKSVVAWLDQRGYLKIILIGFEVCMGLLVVGVLAILMHDKILTWRVLAVALLTIERVGRLLVRTAPIWWPVVAGWFRKEPNS